MMVVVLSIFFEKKKRGFGREGVLCSLFFVRCSLFFVRSLGGKDFKEFEDFEDGVML